MSRTCRLKPRAILSPEGSVPAPPPPLPAAAYLRLSAQDKGSSLSHQEAVIRGYVHLHPELSLIKIYTDNGVSGTVFHRPALDALLEDMRSGLIRCILVKDLSRLGRNYLEAGTLTEEVFPRYGVRFVAVTEAYDTGLTRDIPLKIPLEHLINEAYARDISRKVSTALEARKKQGQFLGRLPPYGYVRDPRNPRTLLPDPPAARILRRIFSDFLAGSTLSGIARALNTAAVPCPSRHFARAGTVTPSPSSCTRWDRQTVRRLLSNPMYLGNLVYGKTHQSFASREAATVLPPEKWQISPHTHAPLIPSEVFEAAQMLLAGNRRHPGEEAG